MDIKKKYPAITLFIVFIVLLPLFNCINTIDMEPEMSITVMTPNQELKTSEITLIDKVYNFTTWRSEKMLEDLPFKAEYNYYIYFQIVTPHVCNITITLFDPEGSVFDVYQDDYFGQENGTLNFPLGAALTGGHDILFELDIEYNLNMYIKIEETIKCLHEVIPWPDIPNIIYDGVIKFDDSLPFIKNLVLESDVSYKLYLARSNPISTEIPDNTIYYDFSLTDSDQNILFEINWRNTPLKPVGEVTVYSFGTAHGGPYLLNLSVQYDYNPVYIAYAIIYDYKISGEIDENDTITDETPESPLVFSIPVELATGTMIGIGALMLIALGVVVSKRRELNSP